MSGPVLVGTPVQFHAIGPVRNASGAVTYKWDWEGRGSYATSTAVGVATHVFTRAGPIVVAVLAIDARGHSMTARRLVAVVARHPRAHARSRHHGHRRAANAAAHVARDPAVTIKDFSFGPSSITIHAGETVTWVNKGPSSHTATGQGSFDTGTLRAGQSASHAFTSPGTFSYICSIHPFMRAKVVVLANATTNSTAKSQPTPTKAAGAAPAEARTRGRELPNTGMNLLGESSLGLGLLLLGVLLVLSARRRDHR